MFGCEKCELDLRGELSLLRLHIKEEVNLPRLGVLQSFTKRVVFLPLCPPLSLLFLGTGKRGGNGSWLAAHPCL
ncbi:hypothetical protein RHMOL_Rhmol04G0241800 [Rhododendron molle]|uniref:Uncharacterized protein n=1 Tax=Rhododendron molle TaxID=49168 RepID=A0ACC0P5E8_RHOML|nr:hypothetical protein RHMOL_Rhmol04G0241800 [Rhododendron molle]